MKAIKCELCGSTEVIKQEGLYVCQHCRTKYAPEEAKKLLVDSPIRIDKSGYIKNYLEIVRQALAAGNGAEAESYCNKILEIDPGNAEAWRMKANAVVKQSTMESIRFHEASTYFIKAISLTDETDKEFRDKVAEEFRGNAFTVITGMGVQFVKDPGDFETKSFCIALDSIISGIDEYSKKCGVDITDIWAELARIVDHVVKHAWEDNILPEYMNWGQRRPAHALRDFLNKETNCRVLLKRAINLSNEDDKDDILRHEVAINLHYHALGACSYTNASGFWVTDQQLDKPSKEKRRRLIEESKMAIERIKARMLEKHWKENPDYLRELGEYEGRIAELEDEKKKLGLFDGMKKRKIESDIAVLNEKMSGIHDAMRDAVNDAIYKG